MLHPNGIAIRNAVQLAIDQANEAGRLAGVELALKAYDIGGDERRRSSSGRGRRTQDGRRSTDDCGRRAVHVPRGREHDPDHEPGRAARVQPVHLVWWLDEARARRPRVSGGTPGSHQLRPALPGRRRPNAGTRSVRHTRSRRRIGSGHRRSGLAGRCHRLRRSLHRAWWTGRSGKAEAAGTSPAAALGPLDDASAPDVVVFAGDTESGAAGVRRAMREAGHESTPFVSWDGILDRLGRSCRLVPATGGQGCSRNLRRACLDRAAESGLRRCLSIGLRRGTDRLRGRRVCVRAGDPRLARGRRRRRPGCGRAQGGSSRICRRSCPSIRNRHRYRGLRRQRRLDAAGGVVLSRRPSRRPTERATGISIKQQDFGPPQ